MRTAGHIELGSWDTEVGPVQVTVSASTIRNLVSISAMRSRMALDPRLQEYPAPAQVRWYVQRYYEEYRNILQEWRTAEPPIIGCGAAIHICVREQMRTECEEHAEVEQRPAYLALHDWFLAQVSGTAVQTAVKTPAPGAAAQQPVPPQQTVRTPPVEHVDDLEPEYGSADFAATLRDTAAQPEAAAVSVKQQHSALRREQDMWF
jgi:hypothetical protein